ncbi:hypothetical protein PsalBI1_01157 [Piscirickettsia salmonis]|nr:hypothetical protein PsalBI1_01157 [Piscirickettsia salmonis]
MTLMIYFHQSHYRNFKHYYQREVQGHLKKYFPKAVSCNRFVELMPTVLLPLCFFIAAQRKTPTGIYFVDSTVLRVCHGTVAKNYSELQKGYFLVLSA